MAFSLREIVVDTWRGRKASMQLAIDEARKDLLRLYSNCACTNCCPPGKTCLPVLAVQEIEQSSNFPYFTTFTRITYTTPCVCVDPEGYWNQWEWSELPDSAQTHWQALGWSEENWEGTPPESSEKSWEHLSDDERKAAQSLGYDQTSWDNAE